MTKVQNLPPNAPKSPNSHILTWGPFGALRGPSGALGGNIVSLKPLPIKSARKNETFELSMGNTKIFLGVWRVVSMCPTLLRGKLKHEIRTLGTFSLYCSAFWWNRVDKANTVVRSSNTVARSLNLEKKSREIVACTPFQTNFVKLFLCK